MSLKTEINAPVKTLSEEEKLHILYSQYRKIEAEQVARNQKIREKMRELGLADAPR